MHDRILREGAPDAVTLVLFANDTRWTFFNADSC